MSVSQLDSFDLSLVFRCGVDLAQSVADVVPSEWESLHVDIEGPESPDFERWLERHRRLDRIEQNSTRLKLVLGYNPPADQTVSSARWESFDQHFTITQHDESTRLALDRMAMAAIDLSGFAVCREWQWQMRERGLRLLTQGLAQLWDGLTAKEKSSLSDCLSQTRRAIDWPRGNGEAKALRWAAIHPGGRSIPRDRPKQL
jgi:hypothetical protein